MKTMCFLCLLCALALCHNTAYSQTMVWKMRPTEKYDEINCINKNLYKVVRNGKVGLITADGNVLLEPVNDNIGLYYNDIALITRNDGIGERLVGSLTASGKYVVYNSVYYTIDGLKFFSDGLIAVKDDHGMPGYIDTFGSPILGFDGKYDKVLPFTEGYAAVYRKKKYLLINKDGEAQKFRFTGIAEVVNGTNVYNGQAYVMDENGKFYTYSVGSDTPCKKAKAVKSTALDYLGRFQEVSGMTKVIPFKNVPYDGARGMQPKEEHGLYGYSIGNMTVAPAQFTSAQTFIDDNAVVSLNGKHGIITYIPKESFYADVVQNNLRFYAGNKVNCRFNLSVPGVWQGKDIEVTVMDDAGKSVALTNSGNEYAFAETPKTTRRKTYEVSVYGEGLLLLKTEVEYSFEQRFKCNVCGKDVQDCIYKGKHPNDEICTYCGKSKKDCKYGGKHF